MIDLDLGIPDTDYDESGDIPPFPHSYVPYPSFIRAPQYDGFVITGASDGVLPTQKAVKTYVDNKVATAGNWISIDENNEISAKGDTNTNLGETEVVEKTLYAWSTTDDSDNLYPTIYTESIDYLIYPYYDSQHNPLPRVRTIRISPEISKTYYFNNGQGSIDPLQITIVKKITEMTTVQEGNFEFDEPVTTTVNMVYTRNSSSDTTYENGTIIIPSDEVLPTQKAVKTYVDKKASFTYNSDMQMMIIGGTE